MNLTGRVPVEQLDDERLTNIERRIVANVGAMPQRAPRVRWFAPLAAAVCAAAAAAILVWKLHPGQVAQAPQVALEEPAQVLAVATSDRGGTLDIGDATIESTAGTAFHVARPAGGVLVELAHGQVELEVAKRGSKPPLVVRAGETDVTVVGTHFIVTWDGASDADVRVIEGIVKVTRRHAPPVQVVAGQAWVASRGVVVAMADLPAPQERDTVEPAGKGSGAYEIDMGAQPDLLHGRTAAVPDGRSPGRPVNKVDKQESQERAPSAGGGSGRGSSSGRIDVRGRLEALAPDAPVAVEETTEYSALQRYQAMLGPGKGGDEESRGYYGIAYTQAMKQGRTDEALKTITSYELRFAQGRVYPERLSIAWLKVHIQCKRQLGGACRDAAAQYARIAPDDSPAKHLADYIVDPM